jgi:hypothetical protein
MTDHNQDHGPVAYRRARKGHSARPHRFLHHGTTHHDDPRSGMRSGPGPLTPWPHGLTAGTRDRNRASHNRRGLDLDTAPKVTHWRTAPPHNQPWKQRPFGGEPEKHALGRTGQHVRTRAKTYLEKYDLPIDERPSGLIGMSNKFMELSTHETPA